MKFIASVCLSVLLLLGVMAPAMAQVPETTSCVDASNPVCEQIMFGKMDGSTPRAINVMRMIPADASLPGLMLSDYGWALLMGQMAEAWESGPIVEVTDDLEIETSFGTSYRAVLTTVVEDGTKIEVLILVAVTPEYMYMVFGFNPDVDVFSTYVTGVLNGESITTAPAGYQFIEGEEGDGLELKSA